MHEISLAFPKLACFATIHRPFPKNATVGAVLVRSTLSGQIYEITLTNCRTSWLGRYLLPVEFHDALQTHRPNVQLHIHYLGAAQICDIPEGFQWYSSLRNSKIVFAFRYQNLECLLRDLRDYKEVFEFVHSCPNLRRLELTCWYRGNGPNLYPKVTRPMALDRLKLDGLFSQQPHRLALQQLVNWPLLKRLSITDVNLLRHLPANLTNLRSLKVEVTSTHKPLSELLQIKPFLLGCGNLEVDLTGFTDCCDRELFEHLGRTLKRPRLHDFGNVIHPGHRRILSRTDIQTMGHACPHLESLGPDIPESPRWVGSWSTLLNIVLLLIDVAGQFASGRHYKTVVSQPPRIQPGNRFYHL